MHKIEFESCGRSMRWYEWAVGLFLLVIALGARAESVYKCVNDKGDIAYQDVGCNERQQQTEIPIAPSLRLAPPLREPSPPRFERWQERPLARNVRTELRRPALKEMAYQCRAGDGRVFYRLGPCPHSIAGAASGSTIGKSHNGKGASAHGGSVQVASQRVPRELACEEIHRAGAISRDGHEFDEHVSTYDRNLGRDPCKS